MKAYVCLKISKDEKAGREPLVEIEVANSLGDAIDRLLKLNGTTRAEADSTLKLERPVESFALDPKGLADAMTWDDGPWFHCETRCIEAPEPIAEVVDLVVDLTTPIEIYTDGACSPNPGPGGWAAIIRQPGQEDIEMSGFGGEHTTNNQMELMGAIQALERIPDAKGRLPVTVYTDSQYVKQGIMSWIQGWKRNGWLTSAKKPVMNKDLWQRLDAAAARHKVCWRWVRGHNGNPLNERADQLAVAAGRQQAAA